MYILILSAKFQKQLTVLVRGDSKFRNQISKTLNFMCLNLNHPSFRLHKLSGQDNWSVSVSKSVRIVLHWEKDRLYLLRIGKHEDVY